MKRYNGKNYIEVVAVMSVDNIVTNDRETIGALIENRRVRRFIDRDDARLMERFGVLNNRNMPVILYYHEASGEMINSTDVKREYLIDQSPVTPLELIKKTREVRPDICDTKSAAAFLRGQGHTVQANTRPSLKHKFRDL